MTTTTRTIQVDYLARVEGESSLTLHIEDGVAVDAKLSIFEPPRFFEGILRGRQYGEAPDVTARICGICPVAYLMSACHAMEDALGITLTEPIRALRRMLYAGEWIESHALHMFMLHAPDFLGYPDVAAMAKDHKAWVARGLRMKKAGNALMIALGGREIHPINVRVGGFYKLPSRESLAPLAAELRAGLDDAELCLDWMATFRFPSAHRDYELVALSHPSEYAVLEGRVVSNRGIDIAAADFDATFEEEHAAHSNALRARVRGRGAYLTGPLARFALGFDKLHPRAQAAARRVGLTPPVTNPFRSLLVRGVELIHAFEEALQRLETYVPTGPAFVAPAAIRAGVGHGLSEAPRGLLYHRYAIDDAGLITDARIVPPTSQNQLSIEEDLLAIGKDLATLPLPQATARAEQSVRNHDPCISCATHFLTLRREEGEAPCAPG